MLQKGGSEVHRTQTINRIVSFSRKVVPQGNSEDTHAIPVVVVVVAINLISIYTPLSQKHPKFSPSSESPNALTRDPRSGSTNNLPYTSNPQSRHRMHASHHPLRTSDNSMRYNPDPPSAALEAQLSPVRWLR